MSDSMRQGMGDKAEAAMKPDSQKSTMEKAGDSVKGTADSAAGSMQPEDSKSGTQKASDEGGSMMDSAKDALGMGKK